MARQRREQTPAGGGLPLPLLAVGGLVAAAYLGADAVTEAVADGIANTAKGTPLRHLFSPGVLENWDRLTLAQKRGELKKVALNAGGLALAGMLLWRALAPLMKGAAARAWFVGPMGGLLAAGVILVASGAMGPLMQLASAGGLSGRLGFGSGGSGDSQYPPDVLCGGRGGFAAYVLGEGRQGVKCGDGSKWDQRSGMRLPS
jgi:hypothetical protein